MAGLESQLVNRAVPLVSTRPTDAQRCRNKRRDFDTFINDKSFSNYIDDAYILLGKANFFNGNFFNAAEYFDYTIKNYKDNQSNYLTALNWKARSLMQLKRIAEANEILDTLDSILPKLKGKKLVSESFATLAQMNINLNNDTAAITLLKDAIKTSKQIQNKIRWTYILAQLYERTQNHQEAIRRYKEVQKSNAPFEMYFNAVLNRIRLIGPQNAGKNKQEQLLALLKDNKNFNYRDQVYFQIAESFAVDKEYDKAVENYNLSTTQTRDNQHQKGLSYLRLAELNFKHFRDYLTAKEYYDSTITILPKNSPEYNLILKKTLNLQYLTDRYELIALQDSLQEIARLPEELRMAKINSLINPVQIAKP
ncbi:MAG: hypothetical protein EOP48_28000, partial [Sphingobacteriales bacterium]